MKGSVQSQYHDCFCLMRLCVFKLVLQAFYFFTKTHIAFIIIKGDKDDVCSIVPK